MEIQNIKEFRLIRNAVNLTNTYELLECLEICFGEKISYHCIENGIDKNALKDIIAITSSEVTYFFTKEGKNVTQTITGSTLPTYTSIGNVESIIEFGEGVAEIMLNMNENPCSYLDEKNLLYS